MKIRVTFPMPTTIKSFMQGLADVLKNGVNITHVGDPDIPTNSANFTLDGYGHQEKVDSVLNAIRELGYKVEESTEEAMAG